MGVYRLVSLLSDLVRPCLVLFAGRVRSPRFMKSIFQSVCLASLGVTLFSPFLWAHHSFEAEYDSNKPVTVKGVLAKLDWENPHVFFYVDVKEEGSDVVEHWTFEGFPPNVLVKLGWKREETLKPGDIITVFGWRARDGSTLVHSREITLPDGKKIISGSAAGIGSYFFPAGSGKHN
jgi:hypothetical protein